MDGKVRLLLIVLLSLSVFQENIASTEPAGKSTILVAQEFTPNRITSEAHTSSLLNNSRRMPTSLETDYRPISNPILIIPQQEGPLIDHAPISIHDNADFANQGFPGAGTLLGPYRIEGLNITSSSGNLIFISGTTAYFRISGNYLNGLSTAESAINVDYVIHGTIENNFVVNITHSIGVFSSDDCFVTNNYVYKIGNEGIYVLYSENNTISHNFVNDTGEVAGIALIESTNNILLNNSASNGAGILLELSDSNQLINNSAYENNGNGIVLQHSHFNEVFNNSAFKNSYPGLILDWSNDNKVAENSLFQNREHGLWLFNALRNEIHDNQAYSNNWDGVAMSSSDSNYLYANNLSSNFNALNVEYSANNTFANNTAHQNDNGIYLENCSVNQVINNAVFDNFEGISLLLSENNIISSNTLDGNKNGVQLRYSDFNTLDHNNIANSSWYGIQIYFSNNNVMWSNVLAANNIANAFDSGDNNQWDNGAIGNYWDDYFGEDEVPRDGIGDRPYAIAGNAGAQDHFPLVGLPGRDSFPPLINRPQDVIIEQNTRGHTITWQASDANPDSFMLWHNGRTIKNGTWPGGPL
ncbi:MAG: NosD domain-containing protein, partial [Candidatus Hodarchaeales archaeon]